jgi:ATP-dependent protease ClpP protease subunit
MKNLYLIGEIEEGKTLLALQKQAGDNYADGINLVLNSPGGNVLESDAIISWLKSLKVPVQITLEYSASAASTIVSAFNGDVKLSQSVSPDANVFMIHNSRFEPGSIDKPLTAADLMHLANAATEVDNEIANTHQKATGLPLAKVKQLMDNETTLTANQVKQLGLAAKLNLNNSKMTPETTSEKEQLGFIKALIAAFSDKPAAVAPVAPVAADPIAELTAVLKDGFAALNAKIDALTELQKADTAAEALEDPATPVVTAKDPTMDMISAKLAALEKELAITKAKNQLVAIDATKVNGQASETNAAPLTGMAARAFLKSNATIKQ